MKTFAKLAQTLFCVVLLFGFVNLNSKVKTLTEAGDIQLKTMELMSQRLDVANQRIDILTVRAGLPVGPPARPSQPRPVVTVPISFDLQPQGVSP